MLNSDVTPSPNNDSIYLGRVCNMNQLISLLDNTKAKMKFRTEIEKKSKKLMKGWTDAYMILDDSKLKYYKKGNKFSTGTIDLK